MSILQRSHAANGARDSFPRPCYTRDTSKLAWR